MRQYLTEDYICGRCGFTVRVRILVPKGKEHHALFYRQGIGPEDCLRCKQRKTLEICICDVCKKGGRQNE